MQTEANCDMGDLTVFRDTLNPAPVEDAHQDGGKQSLSNRGVAMQLRLTRQLDCKKAIVAIKNLTSDCGPGAKVAYS